MKLNSIQIERYRSIENIAFKIEELKDKSYSYGLIGVNEAGKSSFLKAIGLKDGLKNAKGETLPLQKDFRERTNPITLTYRYTLSKAELKLAKDYLRSIYTEWNIEKFDFSQINIIYVFDFPNPTQPKSIVKIESILEDNVIKELIEDNILPFILPRIHKTIFWTAEERFLISNPINLADFANDPDGISVPLKNCFSMAGMQSSESIVQRVSLIAESTERESLKEDLSTAVTDHINSVWKDHPIKITFDISDGLINFHVHDLNAKGKAKTADQRSDGFAQFVSFLLTISAQNKNQELTNTILLIDEPETHLHPRAQEDLLTEIISITQNIRNNIVFFATHSNYLIDKKDLSRNYKVTKGVNGGSKKEVTELEKFDTKSSTYAGVTYEVFDIPSTDYHNELYSKLHEQYLNQDSADDKRSRIQNFDENFLHKEKALPKDKPWKGIPKSSTWPTYIRNCIHHPDSNNIYTEVDIRNSIEKLKSYL